MSRLMLFGVVSWLVLGSSAPLCNFHLIRPTQHFFPNSREPLRPRTSLISHEEKLSPSGRQTRTNSLSHFASLPVYVSARLIKRFIPTM